MGWLDQRSVWDGGLWLSVTLSARCGLVELTIALFGAGAILPFYVVRKAIATRGGVRWRGLLWTMGRGASPANCLRELTWRGVTSSPLMSGAKSNLCRYSICSVSTRSVVGSSEATFCLLRGGEFRLSAN